MTLKKLVLAADSIKLTKFRIPILGFLVLVFLIVLLQNAWISDDAFITMRTVDNFVNGYRLTYNVGERVQTYTHPLWFVIIIPLYVALQNPYLVLFILSILSSIAVVLILLTRVSKSLASAVLGLTVLVFSQAFIDYSTSGLENPLTHLLLVIFIVVLFTGDDNYQSLLMLALIAAFASVNRLDTLLLYLQAIFYVMFRIRTGRAILVVVVGFLPLILWESFSLIYYGFPFPNTAYAKIFTGIDSALLVEQGIQYFANSWEWDPVTLLVIAVGVVIPIFMRDWRKLSLSAGLLLYLAYILRIGGDFMAGRYFSVVVLGALAIILTISINMNKIVYVILILLVVFIGIFSKYPPVLTEIGSIDIEKHINTRYEKYVDHRGIANEKYYYYPTSGLIPILREPDREPRYWANAVENFNEKINEKYLYFCCIGFFGYYLGPDIYIIDNYALTDPLRARLEVRDKNKWRIGHFERDFPPGYFETLVSRGEKNQILNPQLASYYDKLSLVIRGNLMDRSRLIEIIKFNVGYYDPLLEAYIHTIN